MKLDRRLTNGLAWAGALLVVGVPVADYFIGRFEQSQPVQVSVVDAGNSLSTVSPVPEVSRPEMPAPVDTAAAGGDAVQSYLDTGRALPSYITGEDVPAAAEPPIETAALPRPAAPVTAPASAAEAPVAPPAVTETPAAQTRPVIETVAALPPKVAPVPMPLSMRPATPVAVAPSAPVLILDEPAPVVTTAPVRQPSPVLVEPPGVVTADDLEGWETGPLSDFLAQRQQAGSSAVYRVEPSADAYPAEGFWLDDAPRSTRRDRTFPPAYDDSFYLPFVP